MRQLFLVAALALLGGCGAPIKPEVRAADHGMVLECHSSGERHGCACTVSTESGDRVFLYRSPCQ